MVDSSACDSSDWGFDWATLAQRVRREGSRLGTDRELDAGCAAMVVEQHADAVVALAAVQLGALRLVLDLLEAHLLRLVRVAGHGEEVLQPEGGYDTVGH